MRLSIKLFAVITLATTFSGCSGDPGNTATDEANSGTVQQAVRDPARACLLAGPKSMAFNASVCSDSTQGRLDYLFYGNDGSGGLYSSSTAFTPGEFTTSAVEDTRPACSPMVFAIIGVGPVTYSSDKAFHWLSISEDEFRRSYNASFGRDPNPATDYFNSFTSLQFMVDVWSCSNSSLPGAGTCYPNYSSMATTDMGFTRSYSASQNACGYTFTIAQRG